MIRGVKRQAGASLIVAMLMLTILAVLGVNAINESSMDLRVVSNMQGRQDAAAAVQDAMEQVLSDNTLLTATHTRTIRIDRTGYGDYVNVSIPPPVCREAIVSEGYSAVTAGAPTEDTIWEITATVLDPVTGAREEVHQGVAVVMRRGTCPTP